MTRLLFSVLVLITSSTVFAQLNAVLRDQLDYDITVNDIWGYAAPDGTEYAIVGLNTGVSFVSLADPDNIREVVFIEGDRSRWRDMKTFGEFAYSVADEGDEGITAFDLRELPDRVTFNRNIYDLPGENTPFVRSHNLYIDTLDGVLLTAGGTRNLRDGGILMFDITADPMNPVLIGMGPEIYAHDVFVLNDTMYASELFRGDLALYDVSDYANPIRLGSTRTPFSFTHNAWSTADGKHVFTTDEVENAPVSSYDVSDKLDIQLIDEYRPIESLNRGVIPHNVHVIDNYLSISYYTDGLRVVDALDPSNLIEVANFDTWFGDPQGFNGAWGAFPYLPSGLTLVSDLSSGLYVIDVDYVRAARLEGTVTDINTGAAINNVLVDIIAEQEDLESTDVLGTYKTGIATAGTYDVTFSAQGYNSITKSVEIENGIAVTLDAELGEARSVNIQYTVVDDLTGEPVSGARILMNSDFSNFNLRTNTDGVAEQDEVFTNEDFDIIVAQWGYYNASLTAITADDLANLEIRLTPGFQDDFFTDEQWDTEGTSLSDRFSGGWVRDFPIATGVAPGTDAPEDLGGEAYVTGNGGGGNGTDDVDAGIVTLISPMFKPLLDDTEDLIVSFSYWFVNAGGEVDENDTLSIQIYNGRDTVTARQYVADGSNIELFWKQDSFKVNDFLTLTDSLQLIITTSDLPESGHIVEAGFDQFLVTETSRNSTATENFFDSNTEVLLFPNPTSTEFSVQYDAPGTSNLSIRVSDATGRVVEQRTVPAGAGTANFGSQLATGFYFVELLDNGTRRWVSKVIKE